MKILKVRFKNINSLYGEWEIDFSLPQYVDNGIFAIVGNTGSGKSSILDAISLALYGRTPRLNTLSTSTNEVMSRGSGDCYAEVYFEIDSIEYSVHWSQRRARGSSVGKLQSNKHKLENITLGKPITEKINQTKVAIEDLTNMNFEQFTRSMLLAQGEFAKFLKASTNERSEILEKITDTSIYSDISIAVHERKRSEDETLLKLQAGAESVVLLDNNEVSHLKEELAHKSKEEKEFAHKEDELRKYVSAYNRIRELDLELASIEKDIEEVEKNEDDFSRDRRRIEIGQLVDRAWGEYALLRGNRKTQEEELLSLQELQKISPDKERKLLECKDDLATTQDVLGKSRLRYNVELEIINKVHQLESQSKMLDEKRGRVDIDSREVMEMINAFIQDNDIAVQLLARNKEELERFESYLEEHKVDSELESQIESITEILKRVYKEQQVISTIKDEIPSYERAFNQARNTHNITLKDKEEVIGKCEDSENECKHINEQINDVLGGQLLSELNTELEKLLLCSRNLDEVVRIYTLHEESKDSISLLEDKISSAILEIEKLEQKNEQYESEMAAVNREIEHLELHMKNEEVIKTLQSRRDELVDGEPCPLCGAKEHPYKSGGIPEESEYGERYVSEKEKKAVIQDEIIKGKECIASYRADVINAKSILEEKEANKVSFSNALSKLLDSFELELSSNDLYSRIEHEREMIKHRIDNLNNHLISINEYESAIANEGLAIKKYKDDLIQLERLLSDHKAIMTAAEKDLKSKQSTLVSLSIESDITLQEVHKLLSKFGHYDLDELKHEQKKIVDELVLRNSKYTEYTKGRARCQKEIEIADARIAELQKGLERENSKLEKLKVESIKVSDELDHIAQARFELYGDKECAKEEERFTTLVNKAEIDLENARELHTKISNDVIEIRTRIDSLVKSTSLRAEELESQEKRFSLHISECGFVTEDDFVSGKIDADEIDSVAKKLAEHEKTRHRLAVKKQDNLEDKNKVLALVDGVEPEDILAEKLNKLIDAKSTLTQEIGAIKKHLESNEEANLIFNKKKETLLTQKAVCRRWDDLHALIGSADGKKYRNFAQGLTFDVMLRYANNELLKMSDRYLLRRAETKVGATAELLELDVIDKDQAGEIRSTKNLSGGESFIVSLALALGLSSMSSKKVEVNSLFLDEGFGTLDEDELDKVLSALSRLQQQGKLIGVISHVHALKERIGIQIDVEKVADGKSVLSGPGCKKL